MKNTVRRDGMGRILGSIEDYWNEDEFESYRDEKVDEVVFPRHLKDPNGEVHVWNLYDSK